MLDFSKQSPLQLLDAQFQTAGQALTDSLDAPRNQAIDHPGDNQWDKAESDIAAKQTQLALAVMGKIGQLAEVAGAVDVVTGVVRTLKDEADRMKNATNAINQVNAVIVAANGVIGLVNNGGKKSN